jgi:uncharacterized protein YjlB
MIHEIDGNPDIFAQVIEDDGTYPNNERIPLLQYKKVFLLSERDAPEFIETTFSRNQWRGSWRNGIYPFHHYHSTAHEVLGIYQGTVRAQFGGDSGPIISAAAGDVILIPAGVAHKNIQSSFDFRVVGAYPDGQSWDMNYGKPDERPGADNNIRRVPLPTTDPLFGENGILFDHWK